MAILKRGAHSQEIPMEDSAPIKVEVRPGGWWIIEDARGQRHRVAYSEVLGRIWYHARGSSYFGEWVEKSSERQSEDSESKDAELVAQFPGRVKRILVEEGAQVNQGDRLILVEAMKMEFTIKAPFAGKILKVLVQPDQQLQPGDRFFDLMPVAS